MPCESFLRYIFTFHLLQGDSTVRVKADGLEMGPGLTVTDEVQVSKHYCYILSPGEVLQRRTKRRDL